MNFYVVEIEQEFVGGEFEDLSKAVDYLVDNIPIGSWGAIFEAVVMADGVTEKLHFVLSHQLSQE